MAVYKEDLDAIAVRGCMMPNCSHENHDTLFMRSACHTSRQTVQVSYKKGSGIVRVLCAACQQVIVEIAVAEKERTLSA